MTINDIAARLRAAGIENAAGEAVLLAAHYTGKSENDLRLAPDADLPDPDGALRRALAKREGHYPLQYLLGTWGFWRQEYLVSPDCLIPRPDTERLVEYAVETLPTGGQLLDLCTGSGCIAISTLCERSDACGVAVDLYENTLAIARANAARYDLHETRLCLVQGDVLAGDFLPSLGAFDLILSNPPYIDSKTVDALAPELAYEPRAALDGGADGLVFYRRMLQKDYLAALGPGGRLAFEIGYDQADALRALASDIGASCEILQDLSGRDRVAVITPPGGAHILE